MSSKINLISRDVVECARQLRGDLRQGHLQESRQRLARRQPAWRELKHPCLLLQTEFKETMSETRRESRSSHETPQKAKNKPTWVGKRDGWEGWIRKPLGFNISPVGDLKSFKSTALPSKEYIRLGSTRRDDDSEDSDLDLVQKSTNNMQVDLPPTEHQHHAWRCKRSASHCTYQRPHTSAIMSWDQTASSLRPDKRSRHQT